MRFKIVNIDKLAIRKKASPKAKVYKRLERGTIVNAIKGKIKTVDGVKFRQIKYGGSKYWIKAKYLKRVDTNYRKLVIEKAKVVYDTIVKVGAKHQSGAHSLAGIKSKKKTTCATAVSAVLQEAGMLPKGKILSHTGAVGSSRAVKKKNTKGKAMSGFGNLKEGTFKCYKVGKSWKHIPAKYKKAGAVLVYDSNIAIYKGDNKFYSANNGSSQKDSKGRYKKVVAGVNSYCGTSPVLYVILPIC